jgi:hypothetical protein
MYSLVAMALLVSPAATRRSTGSWRGVSRFQFVSSSRLIGYRPLTGVLQIANATELACRVVCQCTSRAADEVLRTFGWRRPA